MALSIACTTSRQCASAKGEQSTWGASNAKGEGEVQAEKEENATVHVEIILFYLFHHPSEEWKILVG